MSFAQEVNSCTPQPGVLNEPRVRPRDHIFCDNVTIEKTLKVTGATELGGSLSIGTGPTSTATVTINGKEFIPAVIQVPGPLTGVIMTGPDGQLVQFLPGTTILVSVAPEGFVPSFVLPGTVG